MGRLVDENDVYSVLTEYYHHKTSTQHVALIDALSTVKTADAIPVKDLERIAKVLRNSREYELRVVGNAIPGIVSAWKEKQEERKE